MSEGWRDTVRTLCTLASLLGGVFLGSGFCLWSILPNEPPPAPGEFRCGTGVAIMAAFALPCGAVLGLAAGGLLVAAIRRWGPLKVRWG
jgi:hypothetical protein